MRLRQLPSLEGGAKEVSFEDPRSRASFRAQGFKCSDLFPTLTNLRRSWYEAVISEEKI